MAEEEAWHWEKQVEWRIRVDKGELAAVSFIQGTESSSSGGKNFKIRLVLTLPFGYLIVDCG